MGSGIYSAQKPGYQFLQQLPKIDPATATQAPSKCTSTSRILGCCCLWLAIIIISLLLLLGGACLQLLGPGGTVELLRRDWKALGRRPLGSHGVPIARTFGFPKIEGVDFDDPAGQATVKRVPQARENGKQLPGNELNGSWWRGNELGFLVYNPFFWSDLGIDPPHMALAITPKQHMAVRPFLETIFKAPDPEQRAGLRSMVSTFLADRRAAGALLVQKDIQVMVHMMLQLLVFSNNMSYSEATEFVDLQNSFLTMGVVSEILPGSWYGTVGQAMGLYGIRDSVTGYVRTYTHLLEERFGTELSKLDCRPSRNCTVQLASAVFDSLVAAGGASVPQIISTGLGVLYSTSEDNPVNVTKFTEESPLIPPGQEDQFLWEVIRYYPPVVGFPHWEPPSCNSSDNPFAVESAETLTECANPSSTTVDPITHNQWPTGSRVVTFIGGLMRSKGLWGKTARQFIMRPLDEYYNRSVGFAEMAVDNEVAGGKMNRVCPGKELSITMGSVFFEVFNISEWVPDDTDISLKPLNAKDTVGTFQLNPVGSGGLQALQV